MNAEQEEEHVLGQIHPRLRAVQAEYDQAVRDNDMARIRELVEAAGLPWQDRYEFEKKVQS